MPLLRRAQANSTQSSSQLSKREAHRIHIQAYIMFRSHNEKAGSQLCEEEASFCFILLVSGENPEHFNLCAYYSTFLTKSILRGLAQSLEETTDHRRGRKPPIGLRQQKKPRRGDRVLNMLFANQLDVLSPLRGFCFVDVPEPGVSTPVCVLSHLRCFSPDTNNCIMIL